MPYHARVAVPAGDAYDPFYITAPGQAGPVSGLPADVVDAVAHVSIGAGFGSGSLLWTGQHILTAAHVVDGVDPDDIAVRFDLADGSVTLAAAALHIHADYAPLTGNDLPANDLAIITLAGAAPIPGVALYDGPLSGLGTFSEPYLGHMVFTLAGYGTAGTGFVGQLADDPEAGSLKREGLNTYEVIWAPEVAQILFGLHDPQAPFGSLVFYDFDDSDGEDPDALDAIGQIFGKDDIGQSFYEVNSTQGDSGAPTFVLNDQGEWLIAGIVSGGFATPYSVDPTTTASYFGEMSYDSFVPFYADWIAEIVEQSAETGDDTGAQTPGPVGGEFQVNTTSVGDQWSRDVAPLADGGFIAVWNATQPANGSFGQRYDAFGTPIGGEFHISTDHHFGHSPSVAGLSGGGFVVTWTFTDGDDWGVFSQLYDANGIPVGSSQQVNSEIEGNQHRSTVIALEDGGYVVFWPSQGGEYDDRLVGQRFDADGTPLGPEFQVNSGDVDTPSGFLDYSAASLVGGGFIVTWKGGDENAILGQRFDADGIAVGGEFQASPDGPPTALTLRDPVVAGLADGGFVVAWSGAGTIYDTHAQMFDSSGTPVGDAFQVNLEHTEDNEYAQDVIGLTDGGFVVVFTAHDGDGFGIFGQRFGADGGRLGNEFQINSYTPDWQWVASATALPNGSFVVTWQSDGQDGDGYGVFGQLFATQPLDTPSPDGPCNILLTDGLSNVVELGDKDCTVLIRIDPGDLHLDNANSITAGNGNTSLTILGGLASTIDVGHGNNAILVDYLGVDGADFGSAGETETAIRIGDGDNDIRVTSGTVAVLAAADPAIQADGDNLLSFVREQDLFAAAAHATVVLGHGNNSLVGAALTNTISLGNGNNVASLTGSQNNGLTAGDGNNAVRIEAGPNLGFVAGNENAITLGDGNNSVLIAGGVTNVLAVGHGNNNIAIGTIGLATDNPYLAEAGDSAAVASSTLTLGDGDNVIALTAGQVSFAALDAAGTIDGNNTITLGGTAALGTGIVLGDGNNTLTIDLAEMPSSFLNFTFGDGDNTLTLTGTPPQGYDVSLVFGDGNNVVSTGMADYVGLTNGGDGDNRLDFSDATFAEAYLGTGSNTVWLSQGGSSLGILSTSTGSNTIHLGAGVDDIHLGSGPTHAIGTAADFHGDRFHWVTDTTRFTLTDATATLLSWELIAPGTGIWPDRWRLELDSLGDGLADVEIGVMIASDIDSLAPFLTQQGDDTVIRFTDEALGNRPPVAQDDTVQTDAMTQVLIDVLANDSDPDPGDTLTIAGLNTNILQGLASVVDGQILYSPWLSFLHLPAGETATTSFSYTVADPHGATDTATVTIQVAGTNTSIAPGYTLAPPPKQVGDDYVYQPPPGIPYVIVPIWGMTFDGGIPAPSVGVAVLYANDVGTHMIDAGGLNRMHAGAGSDTFQLGNGGQSTILGSAAQLNGSTIEAFGSQDKIVLEGGAAAAGSLGVAYGSATLSFDSSGDGQADVTITLVGNYLSGMFRVAGSGDDAELVFVDRPESYLILTDQAQDYALPTGNFTRVFASGGADGIAVAAGSSVDLVGMGAGDVVNLQGAAGDYQVTLSGTTVTLVDGKGNVVRLAATANPVELRFADGALDLQLSGGAVRLGGEALSNNAFVDIPAGLDAGTTSAPAFGAPAGATAPPEGPSAWLVMTATSEGFVLQPGSHTSVIGSGESTAAVALGASARFATFGGGSVIDLQGASDAYTVDRSGTTVRLYDGEGGVISVPAGGAAIVLRFADGASELQLSGGQVLLGDQVIGTGAPAAVAPPQEAGDTSVATFAAWSDPDPAPNATPAPDALAKLAGIADGASETAGGDGDGWDGLSVPAVLPADDLLDPALLAA